MKIPKEVKFIIQELKKNGFEAFIVGGCVRDLLRKAEPNDWDVATNANPEQIGKTFKKSFADNQFGTVTVLTDSQDQKLKEIEITPYRTESRYSDKRHPDEVRWAKTIKEDLARRDFTINTIAIDLKGSRQEIIDLFNGQEDLENKIIRAVGNAEDRFSEDALRMMRGVRLATTLGFEIEQETKKAIKKNSSLLQAISKERIRDEFMKIIMADKAADGVELLRELDLLKYIIPELEQGCGISQNKHHIYEVYEHNLLSLKYAVKRKFNKYVRLASLLHDIGKPKTKRGEGPDATFYGHEIVGAKMTAQILNRLKFSKKDIEKIVKLVRHHLFYYNVDEVSESSVRRLVRQTGLENMDELLEVRMADRIGSGCPKAEPYKLRHLRYIIERVSQDPISVQKLEIRGDDIMKILEIQPGPKIGQILAVLLGYVLSDPKKNKKTFLEKEVRKLGKLSEKELKDLAQKARKEREKIETKKDEMTKKKYWVT
ncbi:HD domain-containing protein [Patescibacteria group bacterium]|nr:HD domain-containing protein [Patescibacteria group bacterium]